MNMPAMGDVVSGRARHAVRGMQERHILAFITIFAGDAGQHYGRRCRTGSRLIDEKNGGAPHEEAA